MVCEGGAFTKLKRLTFAEFSAKLKAATIIINVPIVIIDFIFLSPEFSPAFCFAGPF